MHVDSNVRRSFAAVARLNAVHDLEHSATWRRIQHHAITSTAIETSKVHSLSSPKSSICSSQPLWSCGRIFDLSRSVPFRWCHGWGTTLGARPWTESKWQDNITHHSEFAHDESFECDDVDEGWRTARDGIGEHSRQRVAVRSFGHCRNTTRRHSHWIFTDASIA